VIALWLPSLPLLLSLVALRAITGQIFQPASRTAVPVVVPDQHLESANAAIGIGTSGGEALGPLLAAVLFPILGVRGIDDVALVFLATDALGGGDSAAGFLLAAVGIGVFLGYVLLARPHRRSMLTLLLAGFSISSVGNLLTGLAWTVAVAFGVRTIRGVGIAAMDVAVNTLLQRNVPLHPPIDLEALTVLVHGRWAVTPPIPLTVSSTVTLDEGTMRCGVRWPSRLWHWRVSSPWPVARPTHRTRRRARNPRIPPLTSASPEPRSFSAR
jgi:MFS family permease